MLKKTFGQNKIPSWHIRKIWDRDKNNYENDSKENLLTTAEECFPCQELKTIIWENDVCIHKPEVINTIGTFFGSHPLVQKDNVIKVQSPILNDID